MARIRTFVTQFKIQNRVNTNLKDKQIAYLDIMSQEASLLHS